MSRALISDLNKICMQAVDLLRQHGVSEGLGKLYSNLAASYLQMDKPYAAIAACHSALQAIPCNTPGPA